MGQSTSEANIRLATQLNFHVS